MLKMPFSGKKKKKDLPVPNWDNYVQIFAKHSLFSTHLMPTTVRKFYRISNIRSLSFPDESVIIINVAEAAPCVTISSDSDSSDDDDDDDEEEEEEEEDSTAKDIVGSWPSLHPHTPSPLCVFLGTNCSVKINCPLTGLQRHNAVVLDIESISDNTVNIRIFLVSVVQSYFYFQVRVLFCQPTRLDHKPCSYFLNHTCRFGDQCK